ncbi:MAG: hypothetical protein ACRD7E_31750 [Bryobacteraceae bacterium]
MQKWLPISLVVVCSCSALQADSITRESPLDRAFDRLYNFDFVEAHRIVDDFISGHSEEPLPYAVRGSILLFQELDRLGILESEFFSSDDRVKAKRKLKADPLVRQRFYSSLEQAEQKARSKLASHPGDADSLFSLSLTSGLTSDYMALIEKKQWSSLSYVKKSHKHAVALLEKHPGFVDAYLTTGVSEYLIGSLPFFLRWFVRFDGVEGDKKVAADKLRKVAEAGRYLRPFAKVLLAIFHLREKKPLKSRQYLSELAVEFPENPLFSRELQKVSELISKRN